MSRNKDQQKPPHNLNTMPDDQPVRKVTIQQKMVQHPNTSVVTTNNSESFRRYSNIVSHDPSGRGHRGKNWAKPTRGTVANIVKDLDRGVRMRKTMDETANTDEKVSHTEQINENRKASQFAHRTAENRIGKDANKTEARLPPVVPPKPKRKKSEAKVERSPPKTMEIPMETEKGKQQAGFQDEEPKNTRSGGKVELTRKASAEDGLSGCPSSFDGRGVWENTFRELKEKISERQASNTERRKPQEGLNSDKRTSKKRIDTATTKTSERTQNTDTKTPGNCLNNQGRTSVKKKLEISEAKTSEIAAKTGMGKSLAEERISEETHEVSLTKTSENTQKSDMKTRRIGLKNEEGTLDKTKLLYSVKSASEISGKDEIRAAHAIERTLDNPSGMTDNPGIAKLQAERRTSNSPSLIEERLLWEKAVREFQLTIADKDLVIDNLSKVNRKLSEDIEHYVGTLEDRDRVTGDEHMITDDKEEYNTITGDRDGHHMITCDRENCKRITGDKEECQRVIEKHEGKIGELENQLRIKSGEYERIIGERETQILGLEHKLHEMHQADERKGRNSLELSHGSINVLKTLELKKEKVELEEKVQQLEERLKFCESLSENQPDLQENDTRSIDRQAFHEIPPMLYKFRDGIEAKLQENAQIVNTLEEKLIRCVENCNALKELKNKTQKNHVFEEQILQESIRQVESIPEIGLEAELRKEKLINDDLMERFIEIEELNNEYLDSIKLFESKAGDSDVLRAKNEELRAQNEELRAQNEGLLGELSELKENDTNDSKDSQEVAMNDDETSRTYYGDKSSSLRSTLESQERTIRELREKLDENEALIDELREKVIEDEELIEEIRANCQREEKWNREMQRNFEWELSSSAKKDDRIDEFQDCLWAREKLVRDLQQQLDFEDKRCEELLEKLIVSQKEAEDFQEMCKDLRKKLEDSEKRIKEFCDQNDRDAVTLSNLTSENKKLRIDNENLMKARRNLEEDLDRVNGCLEAVEADKENFLTRQDTEVQKLSVELVDKEFTSKGKDEVIEKLQENVVLLSADVQEMEFKLEEGRLTLEEDLKNAEKKLTERDKHLAEALEKYKELQEVYKCLRETISEKEGDVLEKEAVMAHQREVLEGYEKEIESLRIICGNNSTPLNNKPELVYTESEMEEVTDFLEQERTLSEVLRKQISFLENEVGEIRASFDKSKVAVEERNNALISARSEIEEHESRLNETRDDLSNARTELTSTKDELSIANTELSRVKDELILSEQKLDDSQTNTTLLQVDLTELNIKFLLQEAIEENRENEFMVAKEKLAKLYKEIEEVKLENERMKQRIKDLDMEVRELRSKLNYASEQQIKTEQVSSDLNDIMSDVEELGDQSCTESSNTDGKLKLEVENQLQCEPERVLGNKEHFKSKVYHNDAGLSDEYTERDCTKGSQIDHNIKQQHENELQSKIDHLKIELDDVKRERKQMLDENSELKLSLKDIQALNETVSNKNTELQHKVETLTDKWLRSEETLRQAQVNNVNLRYTLEEYVSKSQDQIRHLRDHEREVATLTEHIHEMDILVQGFKISLQEVVNQENKSEQKVVKHDQNLDSKGNFRDIGTQTEPCRTQVSTNNYVSPEKPTKNDSNLKESEILGQPCGAPVTRNNSKGIASSNRVNELSKPSSLQPMLTAHPQNNDANQDNNTTTTSNSQAGFAFIETIYRKILTAKIPKNVILILIFLTLVFCLGCTNNSIISRKYLFVFANSFISLTFFALWVNEFHRNRKFRVVDMILGRKDSHISSQAVLECENCGSGITIQGEEFYRYAKIKSSFQELHEKFLEAVENSSKDTLPIQQLYEKYEKLKDNLEDMRRERLQRDMMTNAVSEINDISKNDNLFPTKWNKAATILGKTLVITLLCEVLYIRGIYFLPSAVNLVSYILSLITFSYFYETICVDPTKREEPCMTTREMELEQETDELNHIIEKEHELVTTQREAIKALEKRLRKEYEKRIKQRNLLLKKLKYKGKLEDLRELLDNDEHDERKGGSRSSSSNQQAIPNVPHMAPKLLELGNNGKRTSLQTHTAMNSNNNRIVHSDQDGHTGTNKVQGGINSDTSGLDMDNSDTHWDNDVDVTGNTKEHAEEVNSTENQITKDLQEIINGAEKGSLDLGFVFSPMFFFLGIPLTGILLSCRYITVSVLMMVIQAALILKDTKFVEVEKLPKVFQKNINPIVLDTIVVLYACILAVFLQCTQSIVVMITCAIVQLAVHWWTSYRLAKKEDKLQEISINCLPDRRKQK